MKAHALKTWPMFWDDVRRGRKTFEVRRNDRDFKVGDVLDLVRWCPINRGIDPDSDGVAIIDRRVTYILQGGQFGIEPGFVVLGLAP